jgi:D-alanyl-D-alanine carboxypeptidase/D-alanyl-D-alanine-endopeptidase (penicillin-binding protein 4)
MKFTAPFSSLPLAFAIISTIHIPAQTSPTALLHSSSETSRASLEKAIGAILADPAVARAHWGISVVGSDGSPLYALNAAQCFEPASNAKLFTTAAALAVFSPNAQFETKAVAHGTLSSDGILHGDIVLEGGGDPSISGRAWPYAGNTERPNPPLQALEEMADQIAKGGLVHNIDGRVIGDDTFFPFERYGTGWGWDDLQWEYGAPVTALTVNDNVIYLNLMPGVNPGDPITVSWNPAVPYYTLETTAVTGSSAPKALLGLDRQPGSKTIRLFGTLPVSSKGEHLALAIEDPAEFAALAFRQMLFARGITVSGNAIAIHDMPVETTEFLEAVKDPLPSPLPVGQALPVPASLVDRLLASRRSPPLVQDLTIINKVSQNLHTELLLRELGKAVLNNGSIVAGARVVRQFLLQAGVDPEDFLFFDGSGLSPQDLITPRAATTLLAYAAHQSWGADFRATLPIAGIDGSLANRFTRSPIKGKLFAKTGTLSEVNALSGYLIAKSGKTIVLSILCNDHDPSSEAARKAADRVVEAIYEAE